MATKEQLTEMIRQLEPQNAIISRPIAAISHDALMKELKAAKRRSASKHKSEAVPATLVYREEDGQLISWRLRANGEFLTPLSYGPEMPMIGDVVPNDDAEPLRVVDQRGGLDIVSGDLEVREQFDPRRIYATPNNTRVTFKRTENNRVVLWSYRIQGEIMIGCNVVMERTDSKAKPTASNRPKLTQKLLAAYLISQNPEITASELTGEIRNAFPHNRIGDRHGPHYLSLSRRGHLPEPPDTDPRQWK